MVSASRCNLLSRSLPYYQKETLGYYDPVANEFHKLLVDLRTHHHHQYKVRRELEEIRDLEADEMPFQDQPGGDGDQFSSLSLPSPQDRMPLFGGGEDDDDDPLLDLGALGDPDDHKESGKEPDNAQTSGETSKQPEASAEPPKEDPIRRVGDPLSLDQLASQAGVKDLVLSGIEAELRALQDEVITPRIPSPSSSSSAPQPQGSAEVSSASENSTAAGGQKEGGVAKEGKVPQAEGDDIDDLLQLGGDYFNNPSLLLSPKHQGEDASGQDELATDWNNFSAFMPATRDEVKSPTSGWERELISASGSSLDNILGLLPGQELTPGGITPPPVVAPSATQNPPGTGISSNPPASAPVSGSSSSSFNPLRPEGVVKSPASPTSPPTASQDISIDQLLGIEGHADTEADAEDLVVADSILSKELETLGLSPMVRKGLPETKSLVPVTPDPSSLPSSGFESINPSLFQMHSMYHPPPAPGAAPQNGNPAAFPQGSSPFPMGTEGPPVLPTGGPIGMTAPPPKFGLVSPDVQAAMGRGTGGRGLPPPASASGTTRREGGEEKGKEGDKGKGGKTWMNFFAHLDPLVNEKV